MLVNSRNPISEAKLNFPRFPTARARPVLGTVLVVGGRVVIPARGTKIGGEKWAILWSLQEFANIATTPVRSRGRRLSLLPLRREPRWLIRVPWVGSGRSSQAPAILWNNGKVAVNMNRWTICLIWSFYPHMTIKFAHQIWRAAILGDVVIVVVLEGGGGRHLGAICAVVSPRRLSAVALLALFLE